MKRIIFIGLLVFIYSSFAWSASLPNKKVPSTKKIKSIKKSDEPLSKINKTPKAIFLIKRAKIDSDIGEPVIYPFNRQLETIYYNVNGGVLKND